MHSSVAVLAHDLVPNVFVNVPLTFLTWSEIRPLSQMDLAAHGARNATLQTSTTGY